MQNYFEKTAKSFLGHCSPMLRLASNFAGRHNNCVTVLVLHDIAPEKTDACTALLKQLKQFHPFLNPKEFGEVIESRCMLQRNYFLLTFDDGFFSNRKVAEQVLEPLGVKAIFFVTTDFIDCKNRIEQKRFIANNLFTCNQTTESIRETMAPMTWDDLTWLLGKGHIIGCHTRTHARLSELKGQKELEYEILSSGDRLCEKLGIQIDHFALPFGDINSIGQQALAIAARRYRFVFSSLRGSNYPNVHRLAIRRETLCLNENIRYNRFVAEGGLQFYYSKKRHQLDKMAQLV